MSLDQTHAVGGFVTPGDQVNMLLNFPVERRATGAATDAQGHGVPAPGPQGDRRRFVDDPAASDAAPTATGPTARHHDARTPQNQPSSLITLQVTPRQAEQIVQGTTIGTVWLSLDPPDFTPGQFKSPTEIVDADQPVRPAAARGAAASPELIQDPPPPSDHP